MLDPTKYPERMGMKWEDEEVLKLLSSIKQKKSIEEISLEHKRTIGGINSQRKKIAAEYYFNDKKTIEEIMKYTGLTKEEIEDTIERKNILNNIKKMQNINKESLVIPSETIKNKKKSVEIPSDIIELKQDVKEIKENIAKILEMMNALYEFENNKEE